MKKSPPLIVHLIYRLDFGGLETLLVDMINHMPADKYQHTIVCLTNHTDFSNKITRAGVEIYSLQKPPGLGLGTHIKLWKLLRRIQPTILHTYNLATIEYAFIAALAGVPVRIHAEHGRDAGDPEGRNRKHNLLRRLISPFIDRFVPVSADLQKWLRYIVGIPPGKIQLISNGVDTDKFYPLQSGDKSVASAVFPADSFVIGTIGRIQDVKNQSGLIDAYIRLRELLPEANSSLRLAIVGNGPLLSAMKEKINVNGIAESVWLPGARSDVADVIRTFSIFVLPSIAEGTPVTILEAMASALPVVATRVGGIPEILNNNVTGLLVPPADTEALAIAIATYYRQPELIAQHGTSGRDFIMKNNSLESMLAAYMKLYDELCMKQFAQGKVNSCAE